jgi:hypothetical protein
MSRFARALADAAQRLTLPEPARSRILLEVAADMEDLHRTYLERGMGEKEAREAVLEHFDLSQEALRGLAAVHDTPLQRSLRGLSGQARRRWARTLLALLGLFVALGAGTLLLQGGLLETASPLAWALLALLAVGLAGGVWKGWTLWGPGSAGRPPAAAGVGFLLGLAALQFGLGCACVWVELYRSGLRIRSAPGEAMMHLVEWLHLASATLVVALSGALILGFLWFFLETRIQHLQAVAAAGLLEGAP